MRILLTLKLALIAAFAFCGSASANPQGLIGQPAVAAKTVRPAFSPLPPKLSMRAFLQPVRNLQQAGGGGGGGCWSHCLNTFDECMGISAKDVCVARVKTCMETCDRLSGAANPTNR